MVVHSGAAQVDRYTGIVVRVALRFIQARLTALVWGVKLISTILTSERGIDLK